ncbi:MAG: WD40 domain-containing protein [Patescibacteria group bacterium]|nr:WD40 domain-containing protein [Patescibacteria group bacterium]
MIEKIRNSNIKEKIKELLKQIVSIRNQSNISEEDMKKVEELSAEIERLRKLLLSSLSEEEIYGKEEIYRELYYYDPYYYPRHLKEVEKKINYRVVEILEGHEYIIYTLQVLPNGTIVSESYDRTIRIWEKKMESIYVGK